MRPLNAKEEQEEATKVVQKISTNAVSLGDQQFTYDAIAGENASQVISPIDLFSRCPSQSVVLEFQRCVYRTIWLFLLSRDLAAQRCIPFHASLTLQYSFIPCVNISASSNCSRFWKICLEERCFSLVRRCKHFTVVPTERGLWNGGLAYGGELSCGL